MNAKQMWSDDRYYLQQASQLDSFQYFKQTNVIEDIELKTFGSSSNVATYSVNPNKGIDEIF